MFSSREIKTALGDTYDYLKKYDPLLKERYETTKLKNKLWDVNPNKICASCGERESKNIRLEAAHIEALEECGSTTIDNLLPLCRRYGVNGRDQGCHTLFDDGHASVNEITKLRKTWAQNESYDLRSTLQSSWDQNNNQIMNMGVSKTDEIQSIVNRGHYRKAILHIRKKFSKKTLSKHDQVRYKIKMLELNRRRTAKIAITNTTKLYHELLQIPIPSDLRSWFYYESGYMFKIMGNHKLARKNFEKSLEESGGKQCDDPTKQVAAHSLILQSKIAEFYSQKIQKLISKKEYDARINTLIEQLKKIENLASKTQNIHGLRWVSTCRWHLVLLYIIKNDVKSAFEQLTSAQKHWKSITVGTGLVLASRPHINSITGICLAHKRNPQDALLAMKYLSRSMVGLLNKNYLQPEGIRDIFFTMIDCLNLIDTSSTTRHIKKLSSVTPKIRDGSAWIHPMI